MHNKRNLGKGAAVRKALSFVKRGIVIIQDADLEYFPEDYPKLISALKHNDVVFGNRFAWRNKGHRYVLAEIGNKFISFLFDFLYRQKIHDINTCYKAFKREALDGITLHENGFLVEEELAVAFAKKGVKIAEVPIRYKGRTFEEGKKIRMKDGIAGLLYILKSRFI